jgi:TRAP-type C4-dicarboxylate transport system permease small subunit
VKDWRAFAAKICGWTAAACVAAMVLLTVADILLRAAANRPIPGAVELVELLLAGSFFLALPAVFLRDGHIVVDVVDGMAPRGVPLLKRIAAALAVLALALMAWQGWISASDALAFGDVTSYLSIPRIVYWIPVLAGIVGAALAALAIAAGGDEDGK